MLSEWELARYVIDAKKCIDSIMFISDNLSKLRHIDIKKRTNSIRNEFFINCCVILDDTFGKCKKELCKSDEVIKSLYYERDKNSAHKDINYKAKDYESYREMIIDMKYQLKHLKKVCKDYLPEKLTLDFVSHDKELFRLVNQLTVDEEEQIKRKKHPGYRHEKEMSKKNSKEKGKIYKIFSDTEDIRNIDAIERNDYATILQCGINLDETLQNLQDGIIRTNVIYKQNMWVSYNDSNIIALRNILKTDIVDKYFAPQIPPIVNYKFWSQVYEEEQEND